MVKTPEYDVERCSWCRGGGQDPASAGMPIPRACSRCDGSGRVFVTSRESATGRRRTYKGAAPFGSKLSGPNAEATRLQMKQSGQRFPKNLEAVVGKKPEAKPQAPAAPNPQGTEQQTQPPLQVGAGG